VNLVLFEPSEIGRPLPRQDRRARHILDVLRRQIGDTFDVGRVNGPRGKATLTALTADSLAFAVAWGPPPPPRPPLIAIIGLPRPQTARDILRDATTLGATALHFVRTEKSEPSYVQSTLWSSGEWRRHVLAGAEQAFDPTLPEVTHTHSLAEILAALPPAGTRLALDNYEAAVPLGGVADVTCYVTLAIGAERGWGPADREGLRAHGFTLAHLGERVLRTETAVTAAIAIVRSKRGQM
jgi:16S rRNA (uracil1498-N3)-methyltransferase